MTDKITMTELADLFGETMPMEAVTILQSDISVQEARAKLRALAGANSVFATIPFDDDPDEVKTWKGLAISAIMDLRRYAHDETPHRRMVSVEAYEADAVRLEFGR